MHFTIFSFGCQAEQATIGIVYKFYINNVDKSGINIYFLYIEGQVMNSRDVIKKIGTEGWYQVAVKGSHHQFKHAAKKGRVTVQHPRKDMPIKTLKSIEKQSGVKLT